ncbi:MAG: hypothetical protein N2483_04940 [Burkholderiaceae bacterium]|nr:hypothetical protein [Burkholderiaceae bacterium]
MRRPLHQHVPAASREQRLAVMARQQHAGEIAVLALCGEKRLQAGLPQRRFELPEPQEFDLRAQPVRRTLPPLALLGQTGGIFRPRVGRLPGDLGPQPVAPECPCQAGHERSHGRGRPEDQPRCHRMQAHRPARHGYTIPA